MTDARHSRFLRRSASAAAVAAMLGVVACGGPAEDVDAPSESAAADVADRPLPTADPFARGYTREDFPRVQEIAPGVYSYEQLRSAGEEWFTTVSMFVVSDEGVLVADGQGNEEEGGEKRAREGAHDLTVF